MHYNDLSRVEGQTYKRLVVVLVMAGSKEVSKGLLERRSMRPIMNKYIVMAEQAGFLDINDWLAILTKKKK